MLFHYIKIALRNLSKYKVQNIISISSLAVGITTLAVVQCFLCLFRKPAVFSQPYADRCYYMNILNNDSVSNSSGHQGSNEDELLRSEGGLSCVERICPLNGLTESGWVWFNMDDGTRRRKALDIKAVSNDYPNFRGYKSAVSGKTVPVLNKNEVLISESLAKKVYGDIKHIGSTISFFYHGEERYFTLADVFEDLPMTEETHEHLIFSIDSNEFVSPNVYIPNYEVVLRKGFTAEQLCNEANGRLKPYNKFVFVMPLKDAPSLHAIEFSDITRSIIWIVGSMVLLSSLISFIRMQIQLMRMRRREFSLRKVNGASTWKLYLMLLIEHTMMVLASVVLALILAQWLKVFADTRLVSILNDWNWKWNGMFSFIFIIGLAIVAICAVVIAFTLNYTLRGSNALSDNMHSPNGLFHKTMLVLQTVICTVFISGTLSLLQFVKGMSDLHHIPDNDRHYKECIYMSAHPIRNLIDFRKEVEKCRFADRVIAYSEQFNSSFEEDYTLKQIVENNRIYSIRNYLMPDTAFFDFYGMKINWFNRPSPDESYILVNEYFYDLLQESGSTDNGIMRSYDGRLLPVAGTYPAIPYSHLTSQYVSIAVISSDAAIPYDQYILEPKKGKYQDLFSEANDLFLSYNPELVDTDVYNLRDNQGAEVTILDAMRGGSFILSCICLIICIMSIYSTLLLSIRARRREVAIRKVNGARRGDIALLFGKLYITLAAICVIISVPIGVLFNSLVVQMSEGSSIAPESLSPLIPVTVSCLFVLLLIAITVSGNIRRVMLENPADVIKSE